jgi:predicted CxxxxCH...CXXCH cytochrome family protein
MVLNKIKENLEMKMKYYLLYILPFVFASVLLIGCADLQTDIAEPESLTFHGPGINNPNSDNFHGKLVRAVEWNMRDNCETCHGADLSGGNTGADCRSCHTTERGPKACNTCHGVFSDPSRIAPPRDISKNIESSERGVGAHTQHLYEREIGARTPCTSCHNLPQNIYDPGHMVNDDLPAEVMLKGRAVLFGAADAIYDQQNGTCSNTYCHGNFVFYRDSADVTNQFAYTADRMVGTSQTVGWTNVNQGEAQCGSCHGLPPEGHISEGITITECYTCHEGVVDQNGNIEDINLHINGEKNSRGNYPEN